MYTMTRSKRLRSVFYINNNPMFFYQTLVKYDKMISTFCYKQNTKTFSMNTNSECKVNNVNYTIKISTIQLLHWFEFHLAMIIDFKNLANFFHEFFIDQTIFNIKKCCTYDFISKCLLDYE